MRVLAIFASAFSGAVFFANYLLPEAALWPVGGGAALLGAALWWLLRNRSRDRKICALLCAGAALGLIWTAAYSGLVFRQVRELEGRTLRLEATVAGWPQETEYGYSVLVRADVGALLHLPTLLYVDKEGAELHPGDAISVVARGVAGDQTFSGEKIRYYLARGIFFRAKTYGGLEIQRPGQIPLRYLPELLSGALKQGIDAAFPNDVAPVIRGIVTGDREKLSDRFTSCLERVGLSHVMSVSGMHLAFLAAMVSYLLGRGQWRTVLGTGLLVVLFCFMTGGLPAVVRATVMILLLQVAPLLDREADTPTSLGLALMLQLLVNPFAAANVGLQLSFGAVAGLVLTGPAMQRWMFRRLRLDKRPKTRLRRLLVGGGRFLGACLCATLGASVLTLPLSALYFQKISLVAPAANVLVLWAVEALFLGGLCMGTLGALLPGAAAVLSGPVTLLTRWVIWVVETLGNLPAAAIQMDSEYCRAWGWFVLLLLGVTLLSPGKKRPLVPVAAGGLTLAVCLLLTGLSFRPGALTAAVLDVGQGQCVLVNTEDSLILVDCGGDGQTNPGDRAADRVLSLGRADIDLLVVSHFHADHANGIPRLLERLRVAAIALPDVEPEDPLRQEILRLAEERGIEVLLIRKDTQIALGEGQKLTLFAPLGRGTATNELGLTVLVTAGEFDVLLPGDMGEEVERLLLGHTSLPDVELLVAGHHGAGTSNTESLLERIRPDVAAISVGRDNRYGHPAQETLERLEKAGAEVYRTDLQGDLMIRAS